MKPISLPEIENAWESQFELDDDGLQELVDRFADEQPYLLVYITEAEETISEDQDEEDESEDGDLVALAVLVWSLLTDASPGRDIVHEEEILDAEAENIRFLAELEDGSDYDRLQAVSELLQDYNQAPLLRFLVEQLMVGNEQTPELVRESVGLELLHLKTLIDCLDQP